MFCKNPLKFPTATVVWLAIMKQYIAITPTTKKDDRRQVHMKIPPTKETEKHLRNLGICFFLNGDVFYGFEGPMGFESSINFSTTILGPKIFCW